MWILSTQFETLCWDLFFTGLVSHRLEFESYLPSAWSSPWTLSGGKFDWGGTSVKRYRRCPKASSVRTETSRRAKGQKLAWSRFSVRIRTAKAGPIDPFDDWEFQSRGVRKVTTGITGLWRPSVHSDVAFWSFDVGSSYHCEAEFAKRWIVHPLIGNVSWV